MNPTGNELMTWLGCLMLIAGICLIFKQLFWGDKTPQPLITREASDFITVEANDKMHDAIDSQFVVVEKRMLETERRMESAILRMESTSETRSSKLHHRLDKIAEEMPQRIITLLQTTGALKK